MIFGALLFVSYDVNLQLTIAMLALIVYFFLSSQLAPYMDPRGLSILCCVAHSVGNAFRPQQRQRLRFVWSRQRLRFPELAVRCQLRLAPDDFLWNACLMSIFLNVYLNQLNVAQA